MKLYNSPTSGNSHKIRAMLAILGIEYEIVPVDLRAGEQHAPAFLAINPRGQVPVLDDDGHVIWDSQAILVYLARRYADESWLPLDPAVMGEVMQWLMFSENEINYGLLRTRAAKNFGRDWNVPEAQAVGGKALDILEARLDGRDWLAAEHPTIADISCYPYVATAPEGDVSLDPYTAVRTWIERLEARPGFVPMPAL